MYYYNNKFLIVGLASSGLSAAKLLLSQGAICYIYDEGTSAAITKNKDEIIKFGGLDATNCLEIAIKECDTLVLSPGIPIDHSIAINSKRAGKRIIGELELGYLFLKAPFVAVTGTNGKTTVCTMINNILLNGGMNSFLAGNIGTPLTSFVNSTDYHSVGVVEVSSFQLETVHLFTPHIAVVLNITEDHLARHYNINNYIFLKSRLLKNLRESEYAVLNADDQIVSRFAEKTKAKVKYFSLNKPVDGAYLQDGKIMCFGETIMLASEVSALGGHNIANVLASCCVAKLLGVSNEAIKQSLSSFKGVKHRIELVAEIDRVKFYNDSKATNVDATIKAIDSIDGKTVVILGGKDKGLNYEELFNALIRKNIAHAVLMGETRKKMLEAAEKCGYSRVTVTANFDSAVKIATLECLGGGNVLLSPACSSFDAFSSYEERGEEFVRLVRLNEKKSVDEE